MSNFTDFIGGSGGEPIPVNGWIGLDETADVITRESGAVYSRNGVFLTDVDLYPEATKSRNAFSFSDLNMWNLSSSNTSLAFDGSTLKTINIGYRYVGNYLDLDSTGSYTDASYKDQFDSGIGDLSGGMDITFTDKYQLSSTYWPATGYYIIMFHDKNTKQFVNYTNPFGISQPIHLLAWDGAYLWLGYNNIIRKYSLSGTTLTYENVQYTLPYNADNNDSMDSDGTNIYIVKDSSVYIYSCATGALVNTLTFPAENYCIAVRDSYIYLFDGNSLIKKYDMSGVFQENVASYRQGVVAYLPRSLTKDLDNNLWVLNSFGYLVKLDDSGRPRGDFYNFRNQATSSFSVTWDGSHFWYAGGARLYRYTAEGVYTGTNVSQTNIGLDLNVDLASDGTHIFLYDSDTGQLEKRDKSTGSLVELYDIGTSTTYRGIYSDGTYLYVGSNKYTTDGVFVSTWEVTPQSNSDFYYDADGVYYYTPLSTSDYQIRRALPVVGNSGATTYQPATPYWRIK